MESSEEKEERNEEIFRIFTRVRTSKGIDKKIFQTYRSSLILLPRQRDSKLWENEEKIKLVSQRVHEISLKIKQAYYFCYYFNVNKICMDIRA